MPFVNISLARGKSGEYLEAVSQAVHDALVAELHMKPEDEFQLIHQHEPGEMVFNRNFRGGPRSDDWIVFTITDGLERGERAKRRFYKTLVRLLQEGPGVRSADTPSRWRSRRWCRHRRRHRIGRPPRTAVLRSGNARAVSAPPPRGGHGCHGLRRDAR